MLQLEKGSDHRLRMIFIGIFPFTVLMMIWLHAAEKIRLFIKFGLKKYKTPNKEEINFDC